MGEAAAPPLEVVGLEHDYGGPPVLAGLDLTLAPGELLAVVGPSGCGKTTLLRAVAGLVLPAAGTIRIAGREVVAGGRERVPAEARRVGLVFQDYALFGHMSARRNVAFGLGDRDPERVDELLRATGLEALGERLPGELSGGQQQRTALARALAPRPHLLLLDEPFANVDAGRRRDLGRVLRDVLAREGASALLVTHDPVDAMGLADRLAVLLPGPAGGRLAQCDEPAVVYRRPIERAVAALLGSVSAVAGEAAGPTAETALGRFDLAAPREGRVELLARPEQLAFAPEPDGPATVRVRRFLGHAYRLELDTPGGPLEVDASPEDAPAAGARGRVTAREPLWAAPGGDGPA